MTTTAAIEPRTKIVGANHTDVQISANPWNQPRIVTGGATGGLFMRDTVQADGWGLIDAVAVGQVLASAGVTTAPVWTSSPTVTSITVTTINTPGGGAIGTPGAPFASGTFSSYVAIGTTPATTGAIRLANNAGIYARNAANSADITLIKSDPSNQITIGGGGVAIAAGIDVGPSHVSLGATDGATSSYTWGVINTGAFVPSTDNAFDLGSTGSTPKRARSGYFGTSVSTPRLNTPTGDIQVAGNLYPTTDTTNVLGTPTNRWSMGYFGTSVSVGTNPAATGAIRLPVGSAGVINARNVAGTQDVRLMVLSTTDQVIIGNAFAAAIVLNAPLVTADTAISIGTNPATAGAIRLANNTGIYARNAANTADGKLLATDANNVTHVSGPTFTLAVDATVTLGGPLVAGGYIFIILGDGRQGAYVVSADGSGTLVFNDPWGILSVVANTASKLNLYWSGGQLTLQNKLASTVTLKLIMIGY